MSAWIVSRRHIDMVVAAILSSELVPEAYALGADALGRMLWQECHDSVAARYPRDTDAELPGHGWDAQEAAEYTYTPLSLPNLNTLGGVSYVKNALDSYRYQSCEHDAWEGSDAEQWTGRVSTALGEWLGGARTLDSGGWTVDEDYDPATVQLSQSLRTAGGGGAGAAR